jgi:molybdenum cofactor biosynthesis enzyme
MEYNWRVNVGKFEWDKSDGEVRYSYTFTTETGVGFEAFEAIVVTLLKTADELWPKLSAMVKPTKKPKTRTE